MLTKFLASSAAVLALAVAAPALAEPITLTPADVGESFTLAYNGFVDNTPVAGLGGKTTFTLTNATDTAYTFGYTVENTTSGGVESRISSFAFNTDPDIAGAASTGAFNYVVADSRYPNGIGTVDVCFKGGRSNACGGNSGGVTTGNTGTGTLTLSFSDPIDSLTLDDFYVRYQSITGAGRVTSASGEVTSSSTTTTTSSTSGGTPVPEPGMIALFGIGLAGLGFARIRRRSSRQAQPAFA